MLVLAAAESWMVPLLVPLGHGETMAPTEYVPGLSWANVRITSTR